MTMTWSRIPSKEDLETMKRRHHNPVQVAHLHTLMYSNDFVSINPPHLSTPIFEIKLLNLSYIHRSPKICSRRTMGATIRKQIKCSVQKVGSCIIEHPTDNLRSKVSCQHEYNGRRQPRQVSPLF